MTSIETRDGDETRKPTWVGGGALVRYSQVSTVLMVHS